jgi:molybdenum cofactor cytidylyltransferase
MDALLRTRLALGERELISIVGAGGKSTILFTLGRELAGCGARVILTTTTKMARSQVTEPSCWSDDPVSVDQALESGRPLFVAVGTVPGKVTGPTPEAVDRLFAETKADYVVVEADGARSMSVKAPAQHEPVIPKRSTLVVVVVGIDAVGRPLSEVAHRPDRIEAITGLPAGTVLTVADLARILLHPRGGLKQVPDASRIAVAITKITPESGTDAADLRALLVGSPRVGHVVMVTSA